MVRCGIVRTSACLVVLLCLTPPVSAQGKGKGHGQESDVEGHAQRAGERVANEAINAVVDELAGDHGSAVFPGGGPPGLARQGKVPPGLAKQGKTPPGWAHGKKAGWDGQPEHESFIRRLIRGIFGRKAEPSSTEPHVQ